jgi:ElaB/YqjD/DUF883 family membrane-anchored ribosome-binding protein
MESVVTSIASVSATADIAIDASKVVEIMPAILASVASTKEVPTKSSEKAVKAEKDEVSKLTEEQEEVLKSVYEKAKSASETIINEPSISNAVKVAQIVGQTIKLLEEAAKTGKKLAGKDKKIVAMELCRRTIKELIKDESLKENILNKFDTIGEQMLETMIDVSKHLNISVEKVQETVKQVEAVATTSCAWIKPLFSKK